jgi:hypothetical protein
MRISIEQAVTYILAIPAHRSSNESHRRLGATFYDQISTIAYSDQDPITAEYNAEVLGIINAAVRMFSVVHDKMQHQWNELESIKQERESIIKRIRLLSPLENGNYFTKAVAIITPVASAVNIGTFTVNVKLFIALILTFTIGLDAISNIVSYIVIKTYKKKYLQERSLSWETNAQEEYKTIINQVVSDLCLLQNRVFPTETLSEREIDDRCKMIIERKFYL